MKKILMVAFSCQPGKGSEPGVGWNWALQAAKSQNVWVLTRSKMKPYIEPAIPEELKETLHFYYAPSSKRLRGMTIYLEYLAWQHTAYRHTKKICSENNFDYVWHITWGNMFLPTYMYKLGVPFIWGPNGAAEQVPKCFWNEFPPKNRLIHKAKYYMGKNIMHLPWVRKPAEKAALIIARTTDTKNLFPPRIQEKILVHLESIVTPADFQYSEDTPDILKHKGTTNYIYTGRIIDIKNTDVLVDAMKKIVMIQPDAMLHIIGGGGETQLKQKIEAEKMDEHIFMYGTVPRDTLLKAVSQCDVFLFPSLREGASWSLLEAMYYAKPIVAFDTNGMHDTLSKECAVLVKIDENSAEQTNINFSEAAVGLAKLDDSKKSQMGNQGHLRLEKYFYAENISDFITIALNSESNAAQFQR